MCITTRFSQSRDVASNGSLFYRAMSSYLHNVAICSHQDIKLYKNDKLTFLSRGCNSKRKRYWYFLWSTKAHQLYEKLLDTLKADASLYVIDACSGLGSCGVACQMTRRKSIIIEKCEVKTRLISQRLKQ